MRAAMFKKMGGDATKVIVEQDWEKAKAKIEHQKALQKAEEEAQKKADEEKKAQEQARAEAQTQVVEENKN